MGVWPPTLPPPSWGIAEEIYRPQIKTEFESNYIQSRPRAIRARRRLPLEWKVMSEAEYRTLETFFELNQGKSFAFVHPLTGATHTCVFGADTLKSAWLSAGWRKDVQCPIEEV